MFFTDGLTESFNAEKVPLDLEGVRMLLRENLPRTADIVAALERGEAAHRKDAAPHDDLTILVLGLQ